VIINYENHDTAIAILDKYRPDIVFCNGMVEFVNLAFILAAKFKKIPLMTTFFLPNYIYKQQNIFSGIKQQLRYILRNKYPDTNLESKSQPKAMPYFKKNTLSLKIQLKILIKIKILF